MSLPYEGDSSDQNIPGIIGINTAGGTGVLGKSTGGAAGFFEGDVAVTGNITAQDIVLAGGTLGGSISVAGTATIGNTLTVTGNVSALHDLTVAGNQGVGTTAPNARLEVVQSGTNDGIRVSGGVNPLVVATDGTVRAKLQVSTAGGEGLVGTETNHNFGIYTNNGERLTITSGGNVGIGTATPDSSLDVANGLLHVGGGPHIVNPTAASQGAYLGWNASTGETHFINNQGGGSGGFAFINTPPSGNPRTTLMTIGGDGKVGIGTTNPLYQLHVVSPGDFGGENADGTSKPGGVPIIAQGGGTLFGMINAHGRQAFALNIDGDNATSAQRGVPVFYDKYDGNWRPSLSLQNGNVGIGTTSPTARLDVVGDAIITGRIGISGQSPIPRNPAWQGGIHTFDLEAEGAIWSLSGYLTPATPGYRTTGGDLAENHFSDLDLTPGDLVRLDQNRDRIMLSERPNHELVVGIISTKPGFLLNTNYNSEEIKDGMRAYPVALAGCVPCKVTDENGPINRGDLLTSSSTPGHAMKAKPIQMGGLEVYRPGTIIGKALDSNQSGKGIIEVFVTLR